MVLHLSPLPLQGQVHGKPGALETFRRVGRGGKGRIEGRKCPSPPASQQNQPPEHPKPSYKTPPPPPPGYPPKQKLRRKSSLRLDSQEGATPPPNLPSKAPPVGKPMQGRTQTEGKDLKQGAPEATSSLMPPGYPSFFLPATRGGTLSSSCISHPGLGFLLGRSG